MFFHAIVASVIIFANLANCVPLATKDALFFQPQEYGIDGPFLETGDGGGVLEAQNGTYRLPSHIVPQDYQLKIVPELTGRFNFSGEVIIQFYPKAYAKNITLHSHQLNIQEVVVKRSGYVQASKFELDPKGQLLIVRTENTLYPYYGYSLTIKFEGTLNDDMMGFYRSYYKIGKEKM